MSRLPVWATVTSAYGALWHHRWWLLHRAFVPLVFYVAINVWAYSVGFGLIPPSMWAVGSWWFSPSVQLIAFVPLTLFFAPALRRFLLGQRAPTVTWPLPLSSSLLRLFQFLWPYPYSPAAIRIVGLFTLMIVAQTAVFLPWGKVLLLTKFDHVSWSYLAALSGWIVRLIELYVLLRLSFLPVRLVLGEKPAFRSAWHETSGNGGRLLLALLMAQLPVYILSTGLYLAASPVQRILWSSLIGLHWVLTLAVWAAVTAIAFTYLTSYSAKGVELIPPASPNAKG